MRHASSYRKAAVKRIIPICILLLMIALFPAIASAGIKKNIIALKVDSSKKPSARTKNFLNEVEKARSLKDLGMIFQRAKFSRAELKELNNHMKKTRYSSKLQRLIGEAKFSSKSDPKVEGRQIVQQKKRELRQKQDQELRKLNTQAAAKIQRIRAQKPMRTGTLVKRTRLTTLRPKKARMTMDGGTSAATIHSVSPAAVTVGQGITIAGDGFGTSAGRVAIVIGDDLDYCPVSSWGERRIRVTVPGNFQDSVGETEKEGFIWVKLHGGELGPTWDLTIRPDSSRLVPEITSLSTGKIRPGQVLIIEGNNFLTERRGTVQLRLQTLAGSPENFDLTVSDWADTYISGTLEDVSGHMAGRGLITVRNHAGREDTRDINFQPEWVVGTFEFPPNTVRCEVWMNSSCGPFCFVGKKETFRHHSLVVDDGWELLVCYIEEMESSRWTGYHMLQSPVLYTTNVPFDCEYEVWAEMFSYIQVRLCVIAKGPKGIDLWPAYRQ